MEGPEITFAEAVIDNGSYGKRTVRFETGRLAQQAAGAAMVYIDEETSMLSATTVGKSPREGFDFFPLTVDVEERMYAAGRIPGSFFRREGRPSTDAILTCRLIDRPLRPAFVKGIRNEVQVVVTVTSIAPDEIYDTVAINAASCPRSCPACRSPVPSAACAWPSWTTAPARASGSRSRSTPSSRAPCSTWPWPAVWWATTSPS